MGNGASLHVFQLQKNIVPDVQMYNLYIVGYLLSMAEMTPIPWGGITYTPDFCEKGYDICTVILIL